MGEIGDLSSRAARRYTRRALLGYGTMSTAVLSIVAACSGPAPQAPAQTGAAPPTAAAAPKPTSAIKVNGSLSVIQQRGFNPLQTTYIHDLIVKTADGFGWPLD